MTFDITPYLNRSEGSHFERKALFEGEPPRQKPCDRRAVRDEIARQVAGFANAEGGVLILGIDDEGTLSGHRYPQDVVDVMLRVPTDRLDPPQAPGFRMLHQGIELLVFDVAMASEPVQVVGDGYPLRMGESTVQVRIDQIQALKVRGLAESFEARPSTLTLAELDTALLDEARSGAGLLANPPADYLVRRRLADLRGQSLVLRQAAELLFHRLQPEHPNAGIRIFRVVGTERRTGLEHNVEELPRIEGSLPRVLQETYEVVARLLRRPSRLTAGGRFRRFSEYPEFSWKEAILNAVGHRDYAVQGRGIEIWLFDDRMEVTSPGGLVPEVTLEELLTLKRVHYSRNPRLVRTLVDLGFMRDQGEGLPRMFAEMEGQFLPAPELEVLGGVVRLTLRNTMTLSDEDRAFIENLGDHELSQPEFRAMLEAHRHQRVDNERLRALTGLDTLGASKLLRGLRDRRLLVPQAKGSATYYVLAPAFEPTVVDPESRELDPESRELDPESRELDPESRELDPESRELDPESRELDPESRKLDPESRKLDPAHDVPPALLGEIAALGKRPGYKQLQRIITRLCEDAPRDLATLSAILRRNPEVIRRHVSTLVGEGTLRRKFDQPSHPHQAYIAVQAGLEIEDPT